MSEPRKAPAAPVFSPRLDEVMAAMIKGEAPNAGRFCGHCYTPVAKSAEACAYCGRSIRECPTIERLPRELFELYRRMRRRESLIVNSFAFAGLAIALVLFIGVVALAVYRFDQSLWVLALALVVLVVGGRAFAGILGGWIGDSIGYEYAQKKLAVEWETYAAERAGGDGEAATTGADSPRAASGAGAQRRN